MFKDPLFTKPIKKIRFHFSVKFEVFRNGHSDNNSLIN